MRLRTSGQVLAVTDVTQVPDSCWPRGIKTRCRLHYHRADANARQFDRDAVGILLDEDGSVTETSIANLAMVQQGQILSPPRSRVLGGITQIAVERLADAEGIPWIQQPIFPEQLHGADEVLLMGTDIGLWFANRVNETRIGGGRPGAVFGRLLARFDSLTRGGEAAAGE